METVRVIGLERWTQLFNVTAGTICWIFCIFSDIYVHSKEFSYNISLYIAMFEPVP